MENNQKLALVGSGLVVAGVGLGLVGAALIVPAVLSWTAHMVDKGTDGLGNKLQDASKTIGSVAGTLHRSFNEATKAGMSELRRERNAG